MSIDLPRRQRQDVGNIVGLEHVNTRVPRQDLATLFYVVGLGLTRDPYLQVGLGNMWVNAGRQQFHLPTGEAQVLRGSVTLQVPDLEALERRLEAVASGLEGTRFSYQVADDRVEVTSPWGNRIRVVCDATLRGAASLGMPRVELEVATGHAPGIARFYERVLGAPARVDTSAGQAEACVHVGDGQALVFRETEAEIPGYDGHHVAIYIADFSGPYERLDQLGLISADAREHEYRFRWITDPDTGEQLFELEHEVRSVTNPLYARPLVNRNPAQTQQDYVPGHDAYVG